MCLNWPKIPFLNCHLNPDLVSNSIYCTVSLVWIYLPPSSIHHHSSLLHILPSCHHGEEKTWREPQTFCFWSQTDMRAPTQGSSWDGNSQYHLCSFTCPYSFSWTKRGEREDKGNSCHPASYTGMVMLVQLTPGHLGWASWVDMVTHPLPWRTWRCMLEAI